MNIDKRKKRKCLYIKEKKRNNSWKKVYEN